VGRWGGQPDGRDGLGHQLRQPGGVQALSGTVENQVHFYDRFEHIVLLSAPLAVLMQRLRDRTNNPYGRSSAERAETARYVETVEPLLRRGATVELDGRRPVAELADAVEQLVSTP
jgi:shikimate kinase